MKKIIYVLAGVLIVSAFVNALIDCLDREAERQCMIAKDNCEKYSDAGACEPKYLKICEGVKNGK